MRVVSTAAFLLVATLAIPTGQAALNGDHGFAVQLPYPSDLGGGYKGNVSLLSGSLEANMAATPDPMLFFNATAGGITGLTKVCWASPIPACRQSAAGAISITWAQGSSVALKFPTAAPASGTANADHALVFFLNLQQTISFGGVTVHFGRMMATGTIGGHFTFGTVATIPDTLIQDLNQDNSAGLLALDDQTTLTVSGAGTSKVFTNAHDSLTFQGSPVVAPFGAEGMVLPFSAGSLSMGQASASAAAQGLDPKRITGMQARITSATGGQGGKFELPDLSFLGGIQNSVMNGALLTVPTKVNGTSDAVHRLTLIRFDGLHAQGGTTVAATGQGPLTIQDGRVQNAPALIGFAFVQMPWWSYALWILAIAALVTRIVMKAPKTNERWDRLKWIGWIVGPLAFLLFILLWDNEIHTVLGVSLFSGASGPSLGIILLIELLPMGIVFFAVVTPLRMLIRNGLRIAKQGTFMGLAGPAATLLGFLFGATLMLSYFDLVLRQLGGS